MGTKSEPGAGREGHPQQDLCSLYAGTIPVLPEMLMFHVKEKFFLEIFFFFFPEQLHINSKLCKRHRSLGTNDICSPHPPSSSPHTTSWSGRCHH